MKRYLGIMSLAGILLFAAGCTKGYYDRNTNPDQATWDDLQVDDYQYSNFRYMIKNTIPVFQLVGDEEYGSSRYQVIQDLSGNIFSGYAGVTNASFTGNNLYDILAKNWYTFMFDDAFVRPMSAWAELDRIRENSKERAAMADIVKVMVMHRVTDTYGPIPYLSIGNKDGENNYDPQEEIYNKFFEELGDAIDILTAFNQSNPGSKLLERFDDVFAGDVNKWVKFANTLRLRLAMRIRYVNPTLAQQQAELSISNAIGVMTASGDRAWLSPQGTYENPLYMIQYDFNGGDSRAGATIVSYMNAYADARRAAYFTETSYTDPSKKYCGVRNGITSIQTKDYVTLGLLSAYKVAKTEGMLWMSASEAYFLRAEGALQGWAMGGTAQDLYESGIRVSFDEYGLSSSAAGYIAQTTDMPVIDYVDVIDSSNNATILDVPSVAWKDAAGDEANLERIITQKYIAMFPEGQEAWSEFRRTGYPKVIPVKVNNGAGNGISTTEQIRRLNFPSTEYQTNNATVQKAIPVLVSESTSTNAGDNGGTKLWWDKK